MRIGKPHEVRRRGRRHRSEMARSVAVGFLADPRILTDGTPRAGEFVAFDFGLFRGDTVGAADLVDGNGGLVADVLVGSYQLADHETLRLRVTLQASGIVAYSAPITVLGASASTMSAPSISFPAGRVSGTNPPEVVISSADDTIDKLTDSVVLEWDRNASGAFVATGSATFALAGLAEEGQSFVATGFTGLAPGPIRFEGIFTRPPIGDEPAGESPRSNRLSDTLSAASQPAATTVLDESSKSPGVTISSAGRVLEGDWTVRGAARATVGRTGHRRFEAKALSLGNVMYVGFDAGGTNLAQGVIPGVDPSNGIMLSFTPGGWEIYVNGALKQFVYDSAAGALVGDTIICDYDHDAVGDTVTAFFRRVRGGAATAVGAPETFGLIDMVYPVLGTNDPSPPVAPTDLLFNAGQDAPAEPLPAGVQNHG